MFQILFMYPDSFNNLWFACIIHFGSLIWTSQSKLLHQLCLKTFHLVFLSISNSWAGFFSYNLLFVVLPLMFLSIPNLNFLPSSVFVLFPILSPFCCLLNSLTLMAATLISIEEWSQFYLLFLTHIYFWKLVRPTTWEINGGSNAIKYFVFPNILTGEDNGYKSLRLDLALH